MESIVKNFEENIESILKVLMKTVAVMPGMI